MLFTVLRNNKVGLPLAEEPTPVEWLLDTDVVC